MGAATFEELSDEIESLDLDDVVRMLRENEGRRRALEAENALLLARVERDKAYRSDGHASIFGLLRSALSWSESECRSRTQLARLVDEHPAVGEALFEAWVGVANAGSIARAFANPRCGDRIDSVIGTFLTEAQRMEHGDFKRLPERWQLLTDPGTAGEHVDAHANRSAHFGILDDKGTFACEWGLLDAARNREVFDRFLEAEFEADWAWTVEHHGDQASPALMPRTAQQRAADAATAMIQRAAAVPPGSRPPSATAVVHIDWRTFNDFMIEAGLFPERQVDPFEDPTPLVSKLRCETGDGILIDPESALRVLLEGHVRFVVESDEGIPIHWGRDRRLYTGAARDAVMSLFPRCIYPGCIVRAGRSDADHTVEWQHGGETCPDNGGPMCPRHNRLKSHGYTVHRDRHGHWHTYRPDGTEIA
jgi:hypothetical protein